MDLFELKEKTHIVLVEWYSRWPEVKKLLGETSHTVIQVIEETDSIPDLVMSDNDPHFALKFYVQFRANYGFTHVTSPPFYVRTNGEVERAADNAKDILREGEEPHLGLLS